MLLRLIFWILIAIDVAAIGLLVTLGLAAAGSGHTGPFSAVAFLVLWPALLLSAAILLFLLGRTPLLRGVGVLIAASPLLFVVTARPIAELWINQYRTPGGQVAMFKRGPMRDIEDAIARNDAASVDEAARRTNINQTGRDGSSVLVVALRQLENNPGSPDVLRALLQAGANPNQGAELPLSVAIYASPKTGPEPVRMLLDAGANPNQQDQFGRAAYFAATGKYVDPAVMQLLLERGADLRAKSRSGDTALSQALATQNWKVTLLLLQRGADWKTVRTPMGLDFRNAVESNARVYGDQPGLAEVLEFLRFTAR